MRPDFAACGAEFLNDSTGLYSKYVYQGPVHGILKSIDPVSITLDGCKQLCGDASPDYYPWVESAATITTWVLPIIGLLVQLPYESNAAWQTTLSLCRWFGSPIASLSYIFWNIKVTGKCALMVDMATRYDEYPVEGSEFSMMRDSLYILCIMNQYSPKLALPPIEAEGLLRLAVFSNLLQLNGSLEKRDSLVSRRTVLAQELREGRKKGVIPVFISFLWFVFALGLSIELAFDEIGGNKAAHDLALGLLMCWLPIIVVASTVDRNNASADAVREKLNKLVDDVRRALLDKNNREAYMKVTHSTDSDYAWMGPLSDEEVFDGNFFCEFGGQGRVHHFYGVAHPILSGIETKFMAEHGRNWLQLGFEARYAIVIGSRNVNGLKFFDLRMAWQVASAIVVVCGSAFGAFILSWFTPTVGLGCRTGGYLVFVCLALGLLVLEIGVWSLTHETTHTSADINARLGLRLERHYSQPVVEGRKARSKGKIHASLSWFTTRAFRDVIKHLVLQPIEVINTVWLIYITFAQTFGAYQTCECMASNWASGGGYIDFQTSDVYAAHGVYLYWGGGTALSCFVLLCGLCYVVHEYCTQSFLSTEHYDRAMKGLRHTRWFKKHTRFIRFFPNKILTLGKLAWWKIRGGKARKGRRSLVWTAGTKKHPDPKDMA